MRAFLVRLVEHIGSTAIVWAAEGSEHTGADVVVADVASEDGIELIRPAIAHHPDVPLVLITLGPLPDGASAFDAVAVLEKPFSLTEFGTALDAAAAASSRLA
jgi:hypothetical protein